MTQPELTDLIIQSAVSLLAIIAVALGVTGIVTIGLLIEWKLFPASMPFDRFQTLEEACAENDDEDEDNVIFNN